MYHAAVCAWYVLNSTGSSDSELKCMIREWGSLTLFLTCAEYESSRIMVPHITMCYSGLEMQLLLIEMSLRSY